MPYARAGQGGGDERAGRRRPPRHDFRQPGEIRFEHVQGPGGAKEDLLLIMLAGQLEVEIETEKLVLSAGDTLFVRGGVNHRWRQVGRARCRVLKGGRRARARRPVNPKSGPRQSKTAKP